MKTLIQMQADAQRAVMAAHDLRQQFSTYASELDGLEAMGRGDGQYADRCRSEMADAQESYPAALEKVRVAHATLLAHLERPLMSQLEDWVSEEPLSGDDF